MYGTRWNDREGHDLNDHGSFFVFLKLHALPLQHESNEIDIEIDWFIFIDAATEEMCRWVQISTLYILSNEIIDDKTKEQKTD